MATQLTLRGVDKALERSLRQEAKRRGWSLNKTALELLRQATGLAMRDEVFGVPRPDEDGLYHDLDHLAGGWTDEEADEFDRFLAEHRRIEPELWTRAPADDEPLSPPDISARESPRVGRARKSA